MKEISLQIFLHHLRVDFDSARVFLFKGYNLQSFTLKINKNHLTSLTPSQDVNKNSIISSNVKIVDISNNDIRGNIFDSELMIIFPSLWWLNISYNVKLSFESVGKSQPMVLGKLDLLGCHLSDNKLNAITSIVILRLYLDYDGNNNNISSSSSSSSDIDRIKARQRVIEKFPFIWVLNDSYIRLCETISDTSTTSSAKYSKKSSTTEKIFENSIKSLYPLNRLNSTGNWLLSRELSERESIILSAIHKLPIEHPLEADYMRLDILLEDYLEEASIYNKYGIKHQRIDVEPMSYPQIQLLLSLPHHISLDMSILLMASVLFNIPQELLSNSIVILLGPYLASSESKQYAQLPTFAKTAVISIIRRLCKQLHSLSNHRSSGVLISIPMPDLKEYMTAPNLSHSAATYEEISGGMGYYHLRAIKAFLHMNNHSIDSMKSIYSKGVFIEPFSDLEMELINGLPDICTKELLYHHRMSNSDKKYDDWIGLTARHAMLLLTMSPLCPPLIKCQNNQGHQDMYNELLPILSAASMTYKDLDIHTTGPIHDGRILPSPLRSQYCKGGILPYGLGLPNAISKDLSWNQNNTHKNDFTQNIRKLSDSFHSLIVSEDDSIVETNRNHLEKNRKDRRDSYDNTFIPTVIEAYSYDLSLDPTFALVPTKIFTEKIEKQNKLEETSSWSKIDEPPILIHPLAINSNIVVVNQDKNSIFESSSSSLEVFGDSIHSQFQSNVPSIQQSKLRTIYSKTQRKKESREVDRYIPLQPLQSLDKLRDTLFKEMGSKINTKMLLSKSNNRSKTHSNSKTNQNEKGIHSVNKSLVNNMTLTWSRFQSKDQVKNNNNDNNDDNNGNDNNNSSNSNGNSNTTAKVLSNQDYEKESSVITEQTFLTRAFDSLHTSVKDSIITDTYSDSSQVKYMNSKLKELGYDESKSDIGSNLSNSINTMRNNNVSDSLPNSTTTSTVNSPAKSYDNHNHKNSNQYHQDINKSSIDWNQLQSNSIISSSFVLPVKDTIMLATQYPKIYINSHGMEKASKTISGRNMEPTWYPTSNKFTYMIAPIPNMYTSSSTSTSTLLGDNNRNHSIKKEYRYSRQDSMEDHKVSSRVYTTKTRPSTSESRKSMTSTVIDFSKSLDSLSMNVNMGNNNDFNDNVTMSKSSSYLRKHSRFIPKINHERQYVSKPEIFVENRRKPLPRIYLTDDISVFSNS